MKWMFRFSVLFALALACQQPTRSQAPTGWEGPGLRLATWNLKDMGATKSEAELAAMAKALQPFHVVALQEIVTQPAGAQAVARLVALLNRQGQRWNYRLSPPTSSAEPQSQERYAFLWQPGVLSLKAAPALALSLDTLVDREPFIGQFLWQGKALTLVNYHAIPAAKQPEREVKHLRLLTSQFPTTSLFFTGDFNLAQHHSVFGPLKALGFAPALVNQRTSLRQRCLSDGCLASELDNVFYPTANWTLQASGIVHFYLEQPDIQAARQVSDHCPVWVRLR